MQIANPPLLGVLAGIAVGMSPLGAVLYHPSSAAAAARVAQLPMELNACLGACSPCQLASVTPDAWNALSCLDLMKHALGTAGTSPFTPSV